MSTGARLFLKTMVAALALALLQTNKIPLEVMFSFPARASAQISPDGQYVSFLAPSDGHLTVWTQPIGTSDSSPLFKSSTDLSNYTWAPDGKSVLFFQDKEGDEVFHLFSANSGTGEIKDLTPFPDVSAQNLITHPKHTDEILVGMNKRSPGLFDMYRVKLSSGEATLDTENPGDVLSWTVDSNFQIRACSAINLQDASTYVRVRDDVKSAWRELFHAPFDKSLQTAQYQGGSSVVGLSGNDKKLLVVTALRSNTGQLEEWDVATGKFLRKVAGDPDSDIAEDIARNDGIVYFRVLTDPQTGDAKAVCFDPGVPSWHALDRAFAADFSRFAKFQPCDLMVTSRSSDDTKWIVYITSSVIPGRYYLYDRKKRKMESLFDENPQFLPYSFGAQLATKYKARDGMTIPAYLTLPPGVTGKLPLVVMPHGGPWVRDIYGFDKTTQFLATRGYAVLQPQYRGSTGFGLSHLNAATGQWGANMADDITDGVQWAIKSMNVDEKRVAILGTSYGGYATLTALWQNPDMYRCGIDLCGPVDVGSLVAQFKSTWAPLRARWITRIGGDPSADKPLNDRISPISHVDAIKVPVMVVHGKNDPRVKQSQAETIVQALQSKGTKVEYLLYPDEGHGIFLPKNQLDYFTKLEKFLAENMK